MRARVLIVVAACLAACSTSTKSDSTGGDAAEVGTKAETTVGASGGTLATPGNTASVAIPAGAMASDIKLSVTVLAPSSVAAPAASKQPSTSVESNVYDFGPSGTQFSKPVTLTLKSSKAADAGNRHVLAVLDANSVWQALAGSTETNGSVSASTTHFSQYCVLSVPTSGAGCAWQSDPNYCAPLVCDPNADFAGACAAASTTPLPTGGPAAQLAFSTPPPSSVTAGDVFSFTVAIQDASGAVTDSNAPVQFSVSPQGGQPYYGEAVGAVHGYARPLGGGFSLRKAGTYVVDAQSPNLTSPPSATVQVAAGPASPNTTTLTANPASAAVGASVTLILTATDGVGNVLPGLPVAWSSSGAGSTVNPASGTTDANGQATTTLTASSAGAASVRAAVGSVSMPATVQFHGANQGGSGNSSMFAVNSSATADGVHEVQLQGAIRDSSNQPVTGDVTYTVQGSGATVHGGASLDANGNLTATVTSEVGGLKVVTASVGGQQLSTSVFFVPSQCAAPLSQPVRPVVEAVSPGDMAYADLNGDNVADLVAVNGGFPGSSLSVLLGDANGTYGPHTEYTLPSGSIALDVADLNGDQHTDVVVSSNSFGISVLLGNGDGTFQNPTSESSFDPLGDVALADLNKDNKVDIVVLSSTNGVQLRLGNGDGTFKAATNHSLGTNLNRLALGDFDGDHWIDVAVASQTKVTYALYNSANATLGSGTDLTLTVTDGGSVYPSGIAAGDLNGDSIADLAVAFTDSVTVAQPGPTSPSGIYNRTFIVRPFIGASSGFTAGTDVSRPLSGSALFADVDGDSKLDLLTPSGDRVGIALGDGHGAFTVKDDAHTGTDAESVLLIDYDGDGHKDLVVGNGYAHYVSLVPGVGDGTFPKLRSQPVGSQPRVVLSADLNGDASIDVVLVNANSVSVLLNDGRGNLQAGHGYPATAADANITGAVLADVTQDGLVDIVAAGNSAAGLVEVFAGVGDGTFRAATSYAAGGGTQSVAVGDVTGDGVADVVVANSTDGQIAVLAGGVHGSLGAAVTYAAGSAPRDIVLGNLDKDFTLDAVVSNGDGSTASVLLNSSAGFVAPVTYPVGSQPSFVAINDVNSDNIPDLIVANSADGSVSLLVNDGNSLFTNPNTLNPNVTIAGMAVVDLNADANSEIILPQGNSGRPLVMYASGYQGYFTTQATYGGPSGVMGLGDINGDGYPDFIMVDANSNLTVLVNAGCSHVSKKGLADYKQSSVVASPNTAVADGNSANVISGRLVDVAGHPLAGQTLSLSTNGGFGGIGNTPPPIQLTPNPFTTDANGMFSVNATSTVAGQYFLGITQQPSNNFVWQGTVSFTAGPDAALQFVRPPAQAQSGQALQYPLSVQVTDAHGNATNSNASITLSVDQASGATLNGNLTAQASYGTASFPGIVINATGNGNITLHAHAAGLTDATAVVSVYVSSGGSGHLRVNVPEQARAAQPFAVNATLLSSGQAAQGSVEVSVWDSRRIPVLAPQRCTLRAGECALSLTLGEPGTYTLHAADDQQAAAPVDQTITVD